jgi:hypothetical protein
LVALAFAMVGEVPVAEGEQVLDLLVQFFGQVVLVVELFTENQEFFVACMLLIDFGVFISSKR